eukprot:5246289-Amphidinium_carterae.1
MILNRLLVRRSKAYLQRRKNRNTKRLHCVIIFCVSVASGVLGHPSTASLAAIAVPFQQVRCPALTLAGHRLPLWPALGESHALKDLLRYQRSTQVFGRVAVA